MGALDKGGRIIEVALYNIVNYVIYSMELIREQYLFWVQSWQGELEQAKDIDVDREE